MPRPAALFSPPHASPAPRWRTLLGVSLLSHALLFLLIDAPIIPSTPTLPSLPPLAVTLRAAPAQSLQKEEPQEPPVPKPPTPARKNTAAPAPRTTEQSSEALPVPTASLPAPATQATIDAQLNEETTPPFPAGPQYRTAPPPSARLTYEVQALRRGSLLQGSGTIHWQLHGQEYVINGQVNVPLSTQLDFQSVGVIDEYGVAPVRYTRKRNRQSATNTHFHRERHVVSFSASTLSYPRRGGEQDGASLIWQLAAMGRADAAQFAPGKSLSFLVGGVRELHSWRIDILEMEEITSHWGQLAAWHLVRLPPWGSYEQRLDIWLAPELDWYPVKLRYTDYNGDYLDMILSDLEEEPVQ